MIEGMNHVGISVSNLEVSVAFYRDMLQMQVVAQAEFGGGLYGSIMALDGARGRGAFLKGVNIAVELFEFAHPTPKPADQARPVCDRGITHFCIQVTDIEHTYEKLKSAGVRFHCPPLEFPGAAKATYARDPDGNVIELLQLRKQASQ